MHLISLISANTDTNTKKNYYQTFSLVLSLWTNNFFHSLTQKFHGQIFLQPWLNFYGFQEKFAFEIDNNTQYLLRHI